MFCTAAVIDMGSIHILLNALSLALRGALCDGLGKEGHKLPNGASLVEGEGREVGRAAEDYCRLVWGRKDDSERIDLHDCDMDVPWR